MFTGLKSVIYPSSDLAKDKEFWTTVSGVNVHSELKDVGGGMMMGTFEDASGNIFGIIDQPNA